MPDPIAYFITFATYGTRLHGDERGTVDRTNNHYDTPYLPHDEIKRAKRRDDLKDAPLLLDATL
jgi:hypothetical protein